MHTPDQARELWCPMMRIARREIRITGGNKSQNDETVVVAGCNTDALGSMRVPNSCRCIADKCAMWRLGEYSHKTELVIVDDPSKGPGGKREEHQRIRMGYCGLAGRSS